MFARGFKTFCEELAVRVRHDLGLPPAAPLLPVRLAEWLHVTLWTPDDVPGLGPELRQRLLERHTASWSAFSLADGNRWLILYNSAHSAARTASNLMHELAHILLEHRPGKMVITQTGLALRTFDRDQEDQASWLSGCLLLPRAALIHILKSRISSAHACSLYSVSNDLLRFRMNATGANIQVRRAASKR
jgi:hypothetical protein